MSIYTTYALVHTHARTHAHTHTHACIQAASVLTKQQKAKQQALKKAQHKQAQAEALAAVLSAWQVGSCVPVLLQWCCAVCLATAVYLLSTGGGLCCCVAAVLLFCLAKQVVGLATPDAACRSACGVRNHSHSLFIACSEGVMFPKSCSASAEVVSAGCLCCVWAMFIVSSV
eukprot:1157467-Pelagomonas_calceolata.AAC.16